MMGLKRKRENDSDEKINENDENKSLNKFLLKREHSFEIHKPFNNSPEMLMKRQEICTYSLEILIISNMHTSDFTKVGIIYT